MYVVQSVLYSFAEQGILDHLMKVLSSKWNSKWEVYHVYIAKLPGIHNNLGHHSIAALLVIQWPITYDLHIVSNTYS